MQAGVTVEMAAPGVGEIGNDLDIQKVVIHCGRHGIPKLGKQISNLVGCSNIVDAEPWEVRQVLGGVVNAASNGVTATLSAKNSQLEELIKMDEAQRILLHVAAHMYFWGEKLKNKLVDMVEMLAQHDLKQTTIGIKRLAVRNKSMALSDQSESMITDLVIYNILYPVWKAKLAISYTPLDLKLVKMFFSAAPAQFCEERSTKTSSSVLDTMGVGRKL